MTEVDGIVVVVSGKRYNLIESTSPEDSIKQEIINEYNSDGLTLKYLKKVTSHGLRNNKYPILKLDDGSQVSFSGRWSFLYIVKKNNKSNIVRTSIDDNEDSVIDGTIFNDNDMYVDTGPGKRNVYVYTDGGGSRRTYMKYSERARSSKKPSKSRSRKYLKHT